MQTLISDTMHIAIVAAYWHYPEVAYEFLLRLIERGHDVNAILWNQNASSVVRQVTGNGFSVYKVPGINPFFIISSPNKYPYILGLRQVVAKLKPEIVDCQSHLFLTTLQAVRATKELGIPSVTTVHGVMARRNRLINLAQYMYLYTLGPQVFKEANIVRCLTKNDAREIAKYGCPPEKVRVVPNAVDTELFRPNARARRETEKKQRLVVWVGRFVQEKGLEHLIEAARKVVNCYNDVRFVLVGDGPLKFEILKQVDRLGLRNNIHLTGKMEREDVANLLSVSSIFVLPSLREGMPIALLEAMSSGNAVIVSDIPGIDEVVLNGYNGIRVPPKNPDSLAEAILTLLSDYGMNKKLGNNARKTILGKYSWENVIMLLEDLYDKLLA